MLLAFPAFISDAEVLVLFGTVLDPAFLPRDVLSIPPSPIADESPDIIPADLPPCCVTGAGTSLLVRGAISDGIVGTAR